MSDQGCISTNDSNSENDYHIKETCRMARKVNLRKIYEIEGDEIEDERT